MSALGIIVFCREQGAWNDRGLQTKRSHGAILLSRFNTTLRSEKSPNDHGMRNKFRLPLVDVLSYSFQNCGSLHLVQAAASKKQQQKNMLRFKPLISALPSVAVVAEVSHPTSVPSLVSPCFRVRNYCLTRPPFLFTFRVALAVWK